MKKSSNTIRINNNIINIANVCTTIGYNSLANVSIGNNNVAIGNVNVLVRRDAAGQIIAPFVAAVPPILAAPAVNIKTKKLICPTCRTENTIIDIDNCHTCSRSGILPEDYEAKAEKVRELGLVPPLVCCICTERYADVTLPACKHDDVCHKCVVKLSH